MTSHDITLHHMIWETQHTLRQQLRVASIFCASPRRRWPACLEYMICACAPLRFLSRLVFDRTVSTLCKTVLYDVIWCPVMSCYVMWLHGPTNELDITWCHMILYDDEPSIFLTMLSVHHSGRNVHIVRLLRAREREVCGVGSHDNRTNEDILAFIFEICLCDITWYKMTSHDVIILDTFTSLYQVPLVTALYFPGGDGETPDQLIWSV